MDLVKEKASPKKTTVGRCKLKRSREGAWQKTICTSSFKAVTSVPFCLLSDCFSFHPLRCGACCCRSELAQGRSGPNLRWMGLFWSTEKSRLLESHPMTELTGPFVTCHVSRDPLTKAWEDSRTVTSWATLSSWTELWRSPIPLHWMAPVEPSTPGLSRPSEPLKTCKRWNDDSWTFQRERQNPTSIYCILFVSIYYVFLKVSCLSYLYLSVHLTV